MSCHKKYVIIGAGPTGLGAAYRLKELGVTDFVVLEKESGAGGLSTSVLDPQGFTWDIGGHVQFSHYNYFDSLMIKALGPDGWLHHQRQSWIWTKGVFVPYPFQNNIGKLPKNETWQCLQGLIQEYISPSCTNPTNFAEWILAKFGKGIAELFLIPYNRKVWAYPLETLSYSWIGERVAITDLERVAKNTIYDLDDVSWGPNNTFQFPKVGGTGAIWRSVAELVGLEYFAFGCSVAAVDERTKEVSCEDGRTYTYDYLISTMPLDILVRDSLRHIGPSYKEAVSHLKHSTTHIVGVGLKGKPTDRLKTKCWMYFPEDNCPFYRVTVFSNYSPQNVPDISQHWSLMAEVSQSECKPVNRATLVEDTVQGMLATQLIENEQDIVSLWCKSVEYGYPTPTTRRDDVLGRVIPALDKMDIYSRGRFGGWRYEVSNQDHSVMQGVEIINRLELNTAETTFVVPPQG
jgi:protoporphyrinogen oxidase